jgi:hypothetical protein
MANLMTVAPKPKSLLGYHRQLAPNAAVKVSPLCLGTMGFGTEFKDMMGACDKEASFELLDYFYDNGGNFIDTYDWSPETHSFVTSLTIWAPVQMFTRMENRRRLLAIG